MNEEKIRNITNQCLTNWFKYFGEFYQISLPYDEQKKLGVIMGIESLRDAVLQALKEEEKKCHSKEQ